MEPARVWGEVMDIEVNDIASVGSVVDTPDYMLPPEVWTLALNMRARDDALETIRGWAPVFGAPIIAPHFHMSVETGTSDRYWLYVSPTQGAVWNGAGHTLVTPPGGFNNDETRDWNGTFLGGVPIVNNPNGPPAYWPRPYSIATPMAFLTGWPGANGIAQPNIALSIRARIIRSFGPHLMAFNIDLNSGADKLRPHMIWWSHPADPGFLPPNWNYADTGSDAGRTELPDVQSGVIIDALPLGDNMFIYKQSAIWKMRYVGGRSIFDFGQSAWRPTIGLLAARCVAITGDGLRHCLATQDDLVWHDGNQMQSILNKRQKRRLFGEMDPKNYNNSFMFCNPLNNEMWFCYPSQGNEHPNKALIMNYGNGGVWPITEVDDIDFRWATVGGIVVSDQETWDGPLPSPPGQDPDHVVGNDPGHTWDENDGPWEQLLRRRVVLAAPAGTSGQTFYDLDNTQSQLKGNQAFTATLQRTGLALLGKKRTGEWIVDYKKLKMFQRIWPKIEGVPVGIRIGMQTMIKGAVTWTDPVTYDPEQDMYADVDPISGRALAMEIKGPPGWKVLGYKIEIAPLGDF